MSAFLSLIQTTQFHIFSLEIKFGPILTFFLPQRASNRQTSGRKPQNKTNGAHDAYDSRSNHIESSVNVCSKMISRAGSRSNNAVANGDWKVTLMQRKKLENSTNATVQQQCKTKVSGPTSPTEATIAPIYYNGNTNNTRNGKVYHIFICCSWRKICEIQRHFRFFSFRGCYYLVEN